MVPLANIIPLISFRCDITTMAAKQITVLERILMSLAQEEEASGSVFSRSSGSEPGRTAANDLHRGKNSTLEARNTEPSSHQAGVYLGWSLRLPALGEGLQLQQCHRASACLPGQLGGYVNSQPSATHANKNNHVTAANMPPTLKLCQALPTLSIHTLAIPILTPPWQGHGR